VQKVNHIIQKIIRFVIHNFITDGARAFDSVSRLFGVTSVHEHSPGHFDVLSYVPALIFKHSPVKLAHPTPHNGNAYPVGDSRTVTNILLINI